MEDIYNTFQNSSKKEPEAQRYPKRNRHRQSSQGASWKKPQQYENHRKILDRASTDNWRTHNMPGPPGKSKTPNRPSLWRPSAIIHQATN